MNQMQLTLLNAHGWDVQTEQPLCIKHADGSLASGAAVDAVIGLVSNAQSIISKEVLVFDAVKYGSFAEANNFKAVRKTNIKVQTGSRKELHDLIDVVDDISITTKEVVGMPVNMIAGVAINGNYFNLEAWT